MIYTNLHRLRSRLESIEDDDGLKTEIRESIDKQTELLETEQKVNRRKQTDCFLKLVFYF